MIKNPFAAHDRNLSAEFHAAIAETVRFDRRVEEVTKHLFDVMSAELKRGLVSEATQAVVSELAGQMTPESMAPFIGDLLSGRKIAAADKMQVLVCKALLTVAELDAIVDTEKYDPL